MNALDRAIANSLNPTPMLRPVDPPSIPPALLRRDVPQRRTRIWEFASNLHCSIIGTCLSTVELRTTLRKHGLAVNDCSDHDLHKVAVSLAARQDDASRRLNKALDYRHKLAINQFAKAGSEQALLTLWRDAVRRGEIPSAYWAVLTHPHATHAVVREAFGEVHMLSHLVGAANRADLKRLCALEAENATLQAKIERQQQALHQSITARDIEIRDLRQALAEQCLARVSANHQPTSPNADQTLASPDADQTAGMAALHALIADRERRLAAETRRRAAVENRLATLQRAYDAERANCQRAEDSAAVLRRELDVADASLRHAPEEAPPCRLDGISVLYVGGRPNQQQHLRSVAETMGATLLHHDGGIENHTNLLPGLISRCDYVLFPVDCISHDAAGTIKSCCRKAGKRFIPLRSASLTTLLAALRTVGPDTVPDAAD